jgi:hypothetical protein
MLKVVQLPELFTVCVPAAGLLVKPPLLSHDL